MGGGYDRQCRFLITLLNGQFELLNSKIVDRTEWQLEQLIWPDRQRIGIQPLDLHRRRQVLRHVDLKTRGCTGDLMIAGHCDAALLHDGLSIRRDRTDLELPCILENVHSRPAGQ